MGGWAWAYHQSAWVRTGEPGNRKGTGEGGRAGPVAAGPGRVMGPCVTNPMGPHGHARGPQKEWEGGLALRRRGGPRQRARIRGSGA